MDCDRTADQTTEQSVPAKSVRLQEKSGEGNIQKDDPPRVSPCGGHIEESKVKPRLLTVSYSVMIIVQTWLVFGLTIGYTSPVLSDLGGDGNSSAPLDKTSYQSLFSVCQYIYTHCHITVKVYNPCSAIMAHHDCP